MRTLLGIEMRNKLGKEFTLSKYGVDVRYVEEGDAQFILDLRTSPKHSRFLSATDNDLNKQIDWIREYKKREALENEYYFVFSMSHHPYAVSRIYNIRDKYCTGGSWACEEGTDMRLSVLSSIISRDIIFEHLQLEEDHFEVRKKNRQVQKLHELLGAVKIGEDEIEIKYILKKDVYFSNRDKVLRMINI